MHDEKAQRMQRNNKKYSNWKEDTKRHEQSQ